jgi:hypothetical protein
MLGGAKNANEDKDLMLALFLLKALRAVTDGLLFDCHGIDIASGTGELDDLFGAVGDLAVGAGEDVEPVTTESQRMSSCVPSCANPLPLLSRALEDISEAGRRRWPVLA